MSTTDTPLTTWELVRKLTLDFIYQAFVALLALIGWAHNNLLGAVIFTMITIGQTTVTYQDLHNWKNPPKD